MKQLKYLFLLILVPFLACSDEAKAPEFEYINLPVIRKATGGSATIDLLNLPGFNGAYIVDMYYKQSPMPTSADVVIVKNGDRNNQKILQSGVTTFPTELNLTLAQIESLFGEPVDKSDSYQLGVDLHQNGKKYDAFPKTGGIAYGPAFNSYPNSSLYIRYDVPCPFIADEFAGDWEVVEDGWADYAPGTVITVTKVDETTLSFTYPANDAEPILMKFNPATLTITVAKQVFGSSYGNPAEWPYSALSIETEGAANLFSACNYTINMTLKFTVEQGSFGSFPLSLKKV